MVAFTHAGIAGIEFPRANFGLYRFDMTDILNRVFANRAGRNRTLTAEYVEEKAEFC